MVKCKGMNQITLESNGQFLSLTPGELSAINLKWLNANPLAVHATRGPNRYLQQRSLGPIGEPQGIELPKGDTCSYPLGESLVRWYLKT